MHFKYKTMPYQHQKDALMRSFNKRNYAYFMEMGCGKSKVLLDNIAWLRLQKQIDSAIIVAPKGVYRNWELAEIPKHFLDEIEHEVFTWRANPNKQQKESLIRAVKDKSKFRLLLINVEGFATPKVKKYTEAFIKNSNFMLAVDESTTIKNHQAKRTKALISLGKQASYKRILTGSPVTRSPMDLFSQCLFMSQNLLGFDSYWSFQGRYAVMRRQQMGAHAFNQVVGYRNLEELAQRLKTFSFRVTKENVLKDVPPKIYTTREVSLTTEQMQHYQSMKKHALTVVNDELVSATEVMTQLIKLQQLLCGFIVTNDGETIEVKSNRINAMLDAIEEMSGKVIIWARFRKDIITITEVLRKKYGYKSTVDYFGDTSEKDRQHAILGIENDPEVRFFVANPQTGGRGLTLVKATNVIYYSNDFDLEKRIQSEDRNHRSGQTNQVVYVDLIAKGTIDEYIVNVLHNKIVLAGKALNEEAKKWLQICPKKSY
jgi:SNF2 family DNA or RNA helicase